MLRFIPYTRSISDKNDTSQNGPEQETDSDANSQNLAEYHFLLDFWKRSPPLLSLPDAPTLPLSFQPNRYVQACLGMRGDVTVMDQEIMGYEWYIPRVRKLLTQVSFPPVL